MLAASIVISMLQFYGFHWVSSLNMKMSEKILSNNGRFTEICTQTVNQFFGHPLLFC